MTKITDYQYEIAPDQAGLPVTSSTSGDASGGLPGPITVVGIQGVPVSSTAPTAGQVLYFDGTDWTPVAAISEGTHAGRPAAATANTGWLYFETDTLGEGFLSTGSAWVRVSEGTLALAPTGLTGATSASRWVGATASGAPVSGTFAAGDWVIDLGTPAIQLCTAGGTPGTWTALGGGVSFATPAIALGTTAAAGAATTTIRSDSTIVAFDGTNPVTQALGDSPATGSAAFAARRDHKHGMPALSTATPLVESGSGAAGTSALSSREDHVHPAAAGGSGIEITDGTHDVTGATKLTVTGGTVGGSTPNATLTVTGSSDHKVLVDSSDTTADYLANKLSAGTNVTLTVTSPGGNEKIEIASTGGGGGADANHPLPLDSYAIDGTYGDDFTGASLSGSWTRRNFTSGAETYQAGKAGTYLQIATNGRANGDGYFRTAPAGDWTFAMAYIAYGYPSDWGLAVVDTNGTGVGLQGMYSAATPDAPLMIPITTYTTWPGGYYEPTISTGSPNVGLYPGLPMGLKIWLKLRKSGTNYYCAYSLNGEVWSPEGGPIAWTGTVDRVAMMHVPLGGASAAYGYIEVDWFNKIA